MQEDKSIMRFESVLPPDFDGVFRLSNPSKEDFIGIWGSRQYLFPAMTMTPIIIPEHSPIEIQHIRKKFARDLAEREFYNSKGYKILADQEGKPGNRVFNSIHQAATYTLKDLEPYIQKCLEPLTESKLLSKDVSKVPLEDVLRTKDDGSLNSEIIAGGPNWKKEGNISLKQRALDAK